MRPKPLKKANVHSVNALQMLRSQNPPKSNRAFRAVNTWSTDINHPVPSRPPTNTKSIGGQPSTTPAPGSGSQRDKVGYLEICRKKIFFFLSLARAEVGADFLGLARRVGLALLVGPGSAGASASSGLLLLAAGPLLLRRRGGRRLVGSTTTDIFRVGERGRERRGRAGSGC